MRCKKHPTDLSSGVGVCASCLRERLLAIMAAQALKHDCRKIDPQLMYQHHQQTQLQQQPPISFPRSVSPYISRRKSDYAEDAWHLGRRRFYSTPHVGPTGSVKIEIKEDTKRRGGRISSMFWRLFRSRSQKLDFDSGPISEDPCSESPSWFASIIPGRRKKEPRMFPAEGGRRRRNRRNRDRGMSPARFWEEVEEDSHCNGGSSGYSSESSQGWRQTPRRTPASARRGGGGGVGRAAASANYTSNLTFCLSPLVRASPNQRAQKDTVAPAGESRVSAAAFFCKNRSRKLADLGRHNSNPTH